MNLQNFKEAYKSVILESTDDKQLRNYIRSIVEEVLAEAEKKIHKKITKDSHPFLLKAINILRDEEGMKKVSGYLVKFTNPLWNEKERKFDGISFSEEDLVAAETALSKLNDEDLEEFVSGDEDKANDLIASDNNLEKARDFLDVYFEE